MQSLVYGYAGIEKFNALINIPKSMTVKNWNKIVSEIIDVVNLIAEETMNYAAKEIYETSLSADDDINTSLLEDGT